MRLLPHFTEQRGVYINALTQHQQMTPDESAQLNIGPHLPCHLDLIPHPLYNVLPPPYNHSSGPTCLHTTTHHDRLFSVQHVQPLIMTVLPPYNHSLKPSCLHTTCLHTTTCVTVYNSTMLPDPKTSGRPWKRALWWSCVLALTTTVLSP